MSKVKTIDRRTLLKRAALGVSLAALPLALPRGPSVAERIEEAESCPAPEPLKGGVVNSMVLHRSNPVAIETVMPLTAPSEHFIVDCHVDGEVLTRIYSAQRVTVGHLDEQGCYVSLGEAQALRINTTRELRGRG